MSASGSILLLWLSIMLLMCTGQTTSLTSSDHELEARVAELCKLPVNDYYCCKFRDPTVEWELRCQFLLKVVNESTLCQYL